MLLLLSKPDELLLLLLVSVCKVLCLPLSLQIRKKVASAVVATKTYTKRKLPLPQHSSMAAHACLHVSSRIPAALLSLFMLHGSSSPSVSQMKMSGGALKEIHVTPGLLPLVTLDLLPLATHVVLHLATDPTDETETSGGQSQA